MIDKEPLKIESAAQSVPIVVASVALPPPTTGQTTINLSLVQWLEKLDVKLRLIDTSPRSHYRTVFYHLRRIAAVSRTPLILLAHGWRKSRKLYTVIESGLGIFYNFITVAFARLLGYMVFLHHHTSNYAKAYDRRFATLCAISGKRAMHIALSEEMARDLRKLYGVQTVVAHNASHIMDPGTPKPRANGSELTIGFLSNISIEKGVDTV